MRLDIAVLSGDGIGPEVTAQAIKALEAIAHSFDHVFTFKEGLIGATAIDKTGNPLPDKTLELCVDTDAILFGTIGDPRYDQDPTAKIKPDQGLLRLRKELGLFANIRPVKAYKALADKSPLKKEIIEGTDIVIYRELTSSTYFEEKELNEQETVPSDVYEYKQKEVEHIVHLAFKAAQKRRKKLTLVDKANVLESSRLWRRVVTEIAKTYTDVTIDFLYIEDAAVQIILNPSRFDVILTENMFGDIISDEASVISGSIDLLVSASIGDVCCMFEPIHGSYPRIAKKGIANPIAAILSAAMLLEHFNLTEEANAINNAVEKAIELNLTTPDLNIINPLTTEKVGDFIYDYILNPEDSNMNFENIHVGLSTII